MLLLQAVNRNMLLLSTVCFLWVAAVNASFSQTFYTPRLVDSLNNPRSVDSASILPHTDRLWKDGLCMRVSRQTNERKQCLMTQQFESRRKKRGNKNTRANRKHGGQGSLTRWKRSPKKQVRPDKWSQKRRYQRNNNGTDPESDSYTGCGPPPPCLPVGETVDCSCPTSENLPAGGWCYKWECVPNEKGVVLDIDPA